ncbi:MAG: O-antigen ligase family protein, partial [Verrucomicrobia bacterium]|nr:O-antigen ligase family protein [Verrucomicrobiota bacterium]
MSKKWIVAVSLLGLLAFLIPIEHKYDKVFRFYSLTLIPDGLNVTAQYEKKIYFYVSDLIALALCCIVRPPLKRWLSNPLWIVWLCALVSIVVSPFASYPIPYFRLLQLFTPFALVTILTHLEEPQKVTRVILTSLVAAGLLQTVVAIGQYFHQAPLGLRLFGETNQTSIFYTADGSRWLWDHLTGYQAANVILMRAAGTLPHANVLGGFMVLSILATYYLSTRRAWLYTLPFQFFALAVSFSRAALFAWGIASLLWCCLNRERRILAAVMGATVCLAAIFLYEPYWHRGGVANYNEWVQYSDNVRKVQQETGVQIAKAHALFGVGFTQFSERASSYFDQTLPQYIRATAPHNIFLFLACETGLISLAAFLIFLASCLWKFLRAPRTAETTLFFSLSAAFLFIGLCDFYPILFQQGRLMLFLIAGLLIANSQKAAHP